MLLRRTTKTIVTTVDVNKRTIVETTIIEENPNLSDEEKRAIDDLRRKAEPYFGPQWFRDLFKDWA